MALFIVSFVTATFAAFGTDRILSGNAPRFAKTAIIVGAVFAFLGVAGLFGETAHTLGENVELTLRYPNRGAMGEAAAHTIRWSSLAAGAALALAGAVMLFRSRNTLSARAAAFALIAIVGTDMWLNAQAFWKYSRAPEELFAGDAIKARLHSVPRPYRVWDVDVKDKVSAVYPGAALMADDIPQLYGHHGNEPHTFDVLNAREGAELAFDRAGDPRILELFAVNYLILQAPAAPDSIPGFTRTVSNVATSSGATATLFERSNPISYARFVPMAAPSATLDRTVTSLLDPSFPTDRLVLLDSVPGMARGAMPTSLPPSANNPVVFDEWLPGRMRLHLTAPVTAPGYILVSENWDHDWRATVDGHAAPVLRGDATLITVPVTAGAKTLVLQYESPEYDRGRVVSLVSLLAIVVAGVAPIALRRRTLAA
jgi:hypothetical protein